jgi:molybdopterin-guanine dinucleotide biosynthesis protein A
MTRIAGLILAGGAATRMGGGDKPLLDLAGRPMLARILDTLAADLADIAISANGDPARFAGFGRPVLPDGAHRGEGPLAGILAGLDWAAGLGCGALLSVPGDTPFIPRGLAASLAPAPACAMHDGRQHHLVALWPVAVRDGLRSLLCAPGPRSVARFAETIGTRYINFPVGHARLFTNVNTDADLTAARALSGECDDAHGGNRGIGGDRTATGAGA